MNRAEAAGRLLAERHQQQVEPAPTRSLVNYAESPRRDDWSLRSALVRLAQPAPLAAAAVLELVRRLDAALHPLARALHRRSVLSDPSLSLAAVVELEGDWMLPPLADDAYPDARVVDLARLGQDGPEAFDVVVAAYAESGELGDDELGGLPLLLVALDLDRLADVLADWAAAGPEDPPLDAVTAACTLVVDQLDGLGVPRDSGLPNRSRG